VGHIMDFAQGTILAVELKNRTFEPELIVSPGKEKVSISSELALKADEIYWRLTPTARAKRSRTTWRCNLGTNAKERKKIRRVPSTNITKKAVQEAFNHARDIDQNLVTRSRRGESWIGSGATRYPVALG